jgi:hypothetical protein
MSHSHEHSHDRSTYYMEQLCTIGVCGVLGLVAVLLYFQRTADNQRMLDFILARYLHPYVLGCGIGLLGVTMLRGVFLWFSVGRLRAAHSHNHDHGEECHHDHLHAHDDPDRESAQEEHADIHTCGHDHGHEHAWNPWRYIVLCLPIMLFFLGLPNEGFRTLKAMDVEESSRDVSDKEGKPLSLNFKDLEIWAYSEDKREWSEGRTGVLKGQFAPGKSSQMFGLVRSKITCCAADVIQLHVAIISPESVAYIKPGSWVEVTGQIQYRKRKDRDEYVPVLKLRSANDVVPSTADDDPYLQ